MNMEELKKAKDLVNQFEAHARDRYKEYARASDKGIMWPDRMDIYLVGNSPSGPYVLVDVSVDLRCGDEVTGIRYSELRIPFDKLEEHGYGLVLAEEEKK